MLSALLHYAVRASLSQAIAQERHAMCEPEAVGAPPRLYDESALRPLDPQPVGAEASGLVGELLRARAPEARQRMVRGMLGSMGFDWLSYGTVSLVGGRVRTQSFFTTYANAEWVQRYFASNHMQVDPRHQETPLSSLPLTWDLEQIEAIAAAGTACAQQQVFLDDMRACGMHSGMLFRVASLKNSNEHAVIGVQSQRSGRDWISSEIAGQALMLGFSVHEFLARHELTPGEVDAQASLSSLQHAARPPEGAHLSPMQQRILAHLLHGLSDKEIAQRLSVSAHAVDYHMRQLRRRFAVRNRLQLANAVQDAGWQAADAGCA